MLHIYPTSINTNLYHNLHVKLSTNMSLIHIFLKQNKHDKNIQLFKAQFK